MLKSSVATMIALAAASASACTPQQAATAKEVVHVTEEICVPVVSALEPGAEPLCVIAAEIADAAIDYAVDHAGQKPELRLQDGKTLVPADMHKKLALRPSVRLRTGAKRAVCK